MLVPKTNGWDEAISITLSNFEKLLGTIRDRLYCLIYFIIILAVISGANLPNVPTQPKVPMKLISNQTVLPIPVTIAEHPFAGQNTQHRLSH